MLSVIRTWLEGLWQPPVANNQELIQAYVATFLGSPHGRVVLQHMIDATYATVCETFDPIALATHNGRRSVIDEILRNIDAGAFPQKYQLSMEAPNVRSGVTFPNS